SGPTREDFDINISRIIPDFVSVATKIPLCIVGAPGQSKTLSFQIVLQNLQGSQLSPKPFCTTLPAIDAFFCLGSKYSHSGYIAAVFERAIKREQHYSQNQINTRCVVFLDEAGLPDEKKMVLKVLHPYLDESKVAFVAVSNKLFDAANANRMMCIFRSLPSQDDQKTLAFGCLGIEKPKINAAGHVEKIIAGLCRAYREVLKSTVIPKIFHDRDFIYMCGELRFELNRDISASDALDENWTTNANVFSLFTHSNLLRALENNFNGISKSEFKQLVTIFFACITDECKIPFPPPNDNEYRSALNVLRDSMKLESSRRRLYGRYKWIIDESEDESVSRLLFEVGILEPGSQDTEIFRMSDFEADVDNELRNVELLSVLLKRNTNIARKVLRLCFYA
ncbi:unnamed protein product, partial [Didymodactylos carnosus]